MPLLNATIVRCSSANCRKRSILPQFLVTVALLLFFSEGSAMGMFTSLVLFSPVSGVVLKDGVPVANAEVRQEINFFDEKLPSQRVASDSSGRFHFPVVQRSAGLTHFIPHQPVMMQTLIITVGGVDYKAWRHMKDSYELNSELDGHPLNLECELTRDPDFEGKHYGICKAV